MHTAPGAPYWLCCRYHQSSCVGWAAADEHAGCGSPSAPSYLCRIRTLQGLVKESKAIPEPTVGTGSAGTTSGTTAGAAGAATGSTAGAGVDAASVTAGTDAGLNLGADGSLLSGEGSKLGACLLQFYACRRR